MPRSLKFPHGHRTKNRRACGRNSEQEDDRRPRPAPAAGLRSHRGHGVDRDGRQQPARAAWTDVLGTGAIRSPEAARAGYGLAINGARDDPPWNPCQAAGRWNSHRFRRICSMSGIRLQPPSSRGYCPPLSALNRSCTSPLAEVLPKSSGPTPIAFPTAST